MKKQMLNSDGISEAVSVILVISLLLVLAFVVYAMFFGTISLKPTSRVAAYAATSTVPLTAQESGQIMSAHSVSGDNYYLKGQPNIPASTANLAVASYILEDPNGVSYPVTPASLSSSANKYGNQLYIYKGQGQKPNYMVTDNLASISYAPAQITPFALGNYKITMIDNTADVVLNTMDVKITGNTVTSGGGSSLPSPPLLNVDPNSTWTIHGGVTNTTDPYGLTIYTFDGTSGYLSGLSNVAQDFTGNLSLSLWMKPTTVGTNNGDTANWHTIIGKGILNGGSSEFDNYQLVQIGNKLYFEWTDAVNPTNHYHIMTTSSPVLAGHMAYVVLTVDAGVPAIYYDGVAQPFSYYKSNYPTDTTTISPVLVNMQNNNYNLLTGKQNGPVGSEFFFNGDMSEVALYNRALTAGEIAHNLNYHQI
jgi:hypothetical protein